MADSTEVQKSSSSKGIFYMFVGAAFIIAVLSCCFFSIYGMFALFFSAGSEVVEDVQKTPESSPIVTSSKSIELSKVFNFSGVDVYVSGLEKKNNKLVFDLKLDNKTAQTLRLNPIVFSDLLNLDNGNKYVYDLSFEDGVAIPVSVMAGEIVEGKLAYYVSDNPERLSLILFNPANLTEYDEVSFSI